MTEAKPTPAKCPSRLVAPPYGVTGIRYFLAILTTFTTSSVLCTRTIIEWGTVG